MKDLQCTQPIPVLGGKPESFFPVHMSSEAKIFWLRHGGNALKRRQITLVLFLLLCCSEFLSTAIHYVDDLVNAVWQKL